MQRYENVQLRKDLETRVVLLVVHGWLVGLPVGALGVEGGLVGHDDLGWCLEELDTETLADVP